MYVINKELFISCYMCIKSFEKYKNLTHILLYTNTTEDAELAKKYIDEILLSNLFLIKKDEIYNNFLHSKNCTNLNDEINKFKNKLFGIISCVYIFGEGFDLPKLNGVCVSGNMQSEIRIVQYILRPNRLDPENPNKKAYIIIPYIDTDEYKTENKHYEKLKNITLQLRNIDENIEQKISVFTTTNYKKNVTNNNIVDYDDLIFEENNEELNKIKIKLRYSKALNSRYTMEQDEYEYIKMINIDLKLQSKKDYYEKQNIHYNFISFPENYFSHKNVWKNWYDFLGIDDTKFIKSKQEWIIFCREKNIKSYDDYFKLCEMYEFLPKYPEDFYEHFTNILYELADKRRR